MIDEIEAKNNILATVQGKNYDIFRLCARDGVFRRHWVVSPIDGKISAAGVGSLSGAQYIKNNYHLAGASCKCDFLN